MVSIKKNAEVYKTDSGIIRVHSVIYKQPHYAVMFDSETSGLRTTLILRNSNDFRTGDFLRIEEYTANNPSRPTGRFVWRRIISMEMASRTLARIKVSTEKAPEGI